MCNNVNLRAAAGSRAVRSRAGLEVEVELSSRFGANGIGGLQVLREEGGLVLCRGWRDTAEGRRDGVLVLLPAEEAPAAAALVALPTNTP